MNWVQAAKASWLDYQTLDEFTQAYVRQAVRDLTRLSHPHPRSQRLRIDPAALQALITHCQEFQSENADLLAKVYETGKTPYMAGESYWDGRLYDMDDRGLSMDFIVAAHKLAKPKLQLNGDVITLGV